MTGLTCPQCRTAELDVHAYESMIVITDGYALYTVRCPVCNARVSGVRPIPADMIDEVHFAAIQVGAGMGRNC